MVIGRRFLSGRDHGRSTPPAAALALGSVTVLAACQANPADPPAVDPTSTTQTDAPVTQPPAKALREITVGVDPFTTNLNPHVVGNHDPVVAAIADLTLPSVFISGSQGKTLDSNFITDVKTDDDSAPTEVTYTLNPAAQWSDGTPITISDFQYLGEVISKEPTAAGKNVYSHIVSITDGDKAGQIVVHLDEPFTPWKDLFQHLLPSHIYRAEGQNFASMMQGNSAASAGAYAVKSVNEGRGIAELERNDRYWGRQPAKTDVLRFTTVANNSMGAQMLRTEQIQAYRTRPSATTDLIFSQLDKIRTRTTAREVQLNVVLNQASSRMSNRQARQRVLDVLNRNIIGEIVEGSNSIKAPSWNVMPTGDGESESRTSSAGTTNSDDPLILAAPNDDQTAIIAARTAADQLNRAGVATVVRTAEPNDLFDTQLPKGEVDGVVTWQDSADSVSKYMDQFSCSAATSTDSSKDARDAKTTSASETNKPTSTAKAGDSGVASDDKTRPQGGNLGSICSTEIDSIIGKLTRGDESLNDAKEELNAAIARQSTVLPILPDSAAFAALDLLSGPSERLNSWPTDDDSGILISAPTWTLTAKPGQNANGDSNETASPSESTEATTATSTETSTEATTATSTEGGKKK
ncbi:ABC transporter substrate-binding protein [Corynebacterium falsenii]